MAEPMILHHVKPDIAGLVTFGNVDPTDENQKVQDGAVYLTMSEDTHTTLGLPERLEVSAAP